MSRFLAECDRCGKKLTLHDKVQIITLGEVYVLDVTANDTRASVTERRVLVCEEPCV